MVKKRPISCQEAFSSFLYWILDKQVNNFQILTLKWTPQATAFYCTYTRSSFTASSKKKERKKERLIKLLGIFLTSQRADCVPILHSMTMVVEPVMENKWTKPLKPWGLFTVTHRELLLLLLLLNKSWICNSYTTHWGREIITTANTLKWL